MLKSKRAREWSMIYLFLAPSLIIFAVYRITPMFWNLLLSFKKWNFLSANIWVGLKNYRMMIRDPVFWESFKNTIIYFAAGSPTAIIFAILMALLVNQNIRGRNTYRSIIFLPYPLTTVAIGIIWKWLYNEKVGLINYILRSLGIIDKNIPFLNSFSLALPSVIITSIWQVVGFFMIIILTGLQSIPEQLYEAAELDGASHRKRFYYITLPLLKPSIFLCFIIGIINSFTMFDLVYVMTNGGPGHSTEILVSYIYKNAFTFSRIGYAAAITVFLFLFLLFITSIVNRFSGEEAGGVNYYE
ncbi:MAG: sugar ABC transporter permease [Spirochaetes bacterium]|nr:sugar ABC transporter permease [Spirochaetota bacterium]